LYLTTQPTDAAQQFLCRLTPLFVITQIEKIEDEKQAKENENIEQKKEVTVSSESEVK